MLIHVLLQHTLFTHQILLYIRSSFLLEVQYIITKWNVKLGILGKTKTGNSTAAKSDYLSFASITESDNTCNIFIILVHYIAVILANIIIFQQMLYLNI